MTEAFLKIVNMSISASWLVLAVLVLRLILKKAPKWVNVLLWGIVAVRLICPFSIESPVSLIPDFIGSGELVSEWTDDYIGKIDIHHPDSVHYSAAIGAGREPISDGEGGYYVVTKHDQLGEPSTIENTVIPVLSVVWLMGILALLLYTAISYLHLRHKVREAILLRGNVFQSEYINSPFVLGSIKPKIYLPYTISEEDIAHVNAHEQAHIRRRDHWWKPLGFLLLTIHWFNPLLWAAYILLCRDIELACDEKVIKELGNEQRADYSQALVACSVNRLHVAACPLAFGEVGVKERVKSIVNYRKPAFWVIVAAVAVCLVVAVCFLTDPLDSVDYMKFIGLSNDPAEPDKMSYEINLGNRAMGGEIFVEEWTNGACVRSTPVVLTQFVESIHIIIRDRWDGGIQVGTDIQIETDQYGGSLSTYFPYPENCTMSSCYFSRQELNKRIKLSPEQEVILEARSYDLDGDGVWPFTCDSLVHDPEILQDEEYMILIRAVFSTEPLGITNEEPVTALHTVLQAQILEIHDSYFLVEPVEGSWELSSADKIEVPMKNMSPSPEPQAGDILEIEYDGQLQETYPARIAEVYSIKLIRGSEPSDLVRMVMVDGILYLDTGRESTVEARCGVMDGEITSCVDGEKPTKDDQSNFGTGYGYQYGATEGTIEIFMNEKWWVFACEDAAQEAPW